MVEVKKGYAVYGKERERLVFDLMKKFPVGAGNASVILTMEEAAATVVAMGEENARLTAELEALSAMLLDAYGDSTALEAHDKRVRDEETRACAEVAAYLEPDEGQNTDHDQGYEQACRDKKAAILARLDLHKEEGN